MRLRALLMMLAVGSLAAADLPKVDTRTRPEVGPKGIWKVIFGEQEGQVLPEEQISKTTIEFTSDKMTVTRKPEYKFEVRYKIDNRNHKMKTIDLVPLGGLLEGNLLRGIYRIDGDTMKICLAGISEKVRPTEFATKRGSGHFLMVLKKDRK
jgi:uncharacterized protein (TIGR03067 family)